MKKLKTLESKRLVATVAGAIVVISTVQNAFAMGCITALGMTYIICETMRKSDA